MIRMNKLAPPKQHKLFVFASTSSSTQRRSGFTLIEILVTLFILMILTSIALPMTRNIIRDQRNARAAQIVLSFIDSARNQAIAENREMGVIFDRFTSTGFGRSASVQIRQLRGLPPYTGENTKARAVLIHHPTLGWPHITNTNEVNAAGFSPIDSQLLLLSAEILADGSRDPSTAPIRTGDRLELPGGRLVTIRTITREPPITPLSRIIVSFNPHEPLDSTTLATSLSARAHPRPLRVASTPQQVPYAIHRMPLISNSRTVSLPRGTAIDFNYSGFGVRGSEFQPDLANDATVASAISIYFDGKGRISRVGNSAGGYIMPVSPLYFCLGDLDGIRPDDLFADDRRTRANLRRPNSSWIVLNPATGRVSASPLVPPPADSLFTAANLGSLIEQSRQLAFVGDTLE